MLIATKDVKLPTTITGSLPRPSWFTENLGPRSFMEAMVSSTYREQYLDAVSVYIKEQELAGLDIVTDGDAHFDQDVGGQSWTNYPTKHMAGFDTDASPTVAGKGGLGTDDEVGDPGAVRRGRKALLGAQPVGVEPGRRRPAARRCCRP